MKQISIEELVKELNRGPVSVDGMTSREIMQKLKKSNRTTLLFIRECIEQGLLKFAGYRRMTRIDGIEHNTPIYQVVKKKR